MAIPLKDSLLVPYSANFDTRINAAPLTFGLNETQVETYSLRHSAYIAAYNAMMTARADGTRSEALTVTRDTTKSALLAIGRELYKLIQSNTSVSDTNKTLVGVTVPNTNPSPIPAPTARPGMDIVSVVGRMIALSIHDSESVIKRGKPAGAVQALVYYFAGEDYPSDPNGWSFAGPSTRSKFEFTVPDSVAGGTRVWVCAAWTNRAGEPGPTNVPISTNIQGGGASAQQQAMKMAA